MSTDYFTRVRRRELGIARDGGDVMNCGPPKRGPRDKDRVIVHNRVAHTVDDWPGARGFRCWTQLKDKDCILCRCGWGEGIRHFRMRGCPAYVFDTFDRKGKPVNMRRAG
jgi:hypothetical protein